jgi:octaprenyl-diphosphate synthase
MLEKSETERRTSLDRDMEKYRLMVDRQLSKELDRYEGSAFRFPLNQAARGGKRLRPILLILAYKTIKQKEIARTFPAAVAVELAHLESLIHDDIIDKDAERRKSASFHMLYGHEMAILSADFILSIILKLTACYSNPRIPQAIAEATAKMGEGELEEFRICDGNQTITIDKYIDIIEKKTASLFKASTAIGAITAEAGKRETEALVEYGMLLGTAYQIQDDITDLDKRTSINLLALLGNDEISIEKLKATSRNCVEKAKWTIAKMKECEAKRLLIELAESITSPPA